MAATAVWITSFLVVSPVIGAVFTLDEIVRASDAVLVARSLAGSTETGALLRLEVERCLLGAFMPGETLDVCGATATDGPAVWFLALAPDGVLHCVAEHRHPGWCDEIAAILPVSGLRLHLNRTWHLLGEPVVARLELQNRGEVPAVFPGLLGEGPVLMVGPDLPIRVCRLESDTSAPVDVLQVVARRLDVDSPVSLTPGESAQVTFQVDEFADLTIPGLYRIHVEALPEWGCAEVRFYIQP